MKPPTSPRGGRDFCRIEGGVRYAIEEGEVCVPPMLKYSNCKSESDQSFESRRLPPSGHRQDSQDHLTIENNLDQTLPVLSYPSPPMSAASLAKSLPLDQLCRHVDRSVQCNLDFTSSSPAIPSHAVLPLENLDLPASLDMSALTSDPHPIILSLCAGGCAIRCFLIVAAEYGRKGQPGAAVAVAITGIQRTIFLQVLFVV